MESLLTTISLAFTFSLQVFVLVVLIRRRLQRRFFWFLVYIVYELVESILRLSVSNNREVYTLIYWFTEIADVLLSVAAFRESFLNVFRPYTRLQWFVWTVWCFVGSALLYALVKALFFPPVQTTFRKSLIIGLEVAANGSLTAVGICYFAMVLLLKIKERQWETGVISGFTTYAGVGIFGLLVRSLFGLQFRLLNEWIPAIAYIVAEIEWVVVLWRPEREARIAGRDVTTGDLTVLNRYIETMAQFLRKKS